MDAITGLLNSGTPTLDIGLSGALSSTPTVFTAIVDTGFSGFISMPLIKAFPLGLPLTGSTTVTLADGKSLDRLTALGLATLGQHTKPGTIILEPSSNEVLIGMDFLRIFQRALFLTSTGLVFIHEDEFAKYAAAQTGQPTSESSAEQPAKPEGLAS